MAKNLQFRKALEEDALDLACLQDIASRGLAAWFWATIRQPDQSLIEIGRQRIRTHSNSPMHYTAWTIASIEGFTAGALAGRPIPIPYERGDAAELPDIFGPVLELEAIAAGSWYINILSVYNEFRGQGVGSALLRKAEEIAKSSCSSKLSIIVEEANEKAVRLYIRAGFTELARRRYLPFPGSFDEGDWILLAKEYQ